MADETRTWEAAGINGFCREVIGENRYEFLTLDALNALEAERTTLREQLAAVQEHARMRHEAWRKEKHSRTAAETALAAVDGKAALLDRVVPHVRRIVENLDYEYELEAWLAECDALNPTVEDGLNYEVVLPFVAESGDREERIEPGELIHVTMMSFMPDDAPKLRFLREAVEWTATFDVGYDFRKSIRRA